jgi:thioredoxin reductase (NADPH)
MNNIFDCIITGSGPAGMTAALYMCRAGYKTCLIMGQDMFGSLGKISSLENFPGIECITGFELAEKMNNQLDKFVEENLLEKLMFVDAIEYTIAKDKCIEMKLSDGTNVCGKTLIQANGGKHNTLGLAGEEQYFGSGISFCATCDGPVYENKSVIVVGGGNSAFDFALTLSKYCKDVTIIHRRNEFRASKDMIDKVKNLDNIKFILDSNVTNIMKNHYKKMLDVTINEDKIISIDGVFYAIGFTPNIMECVGNFENGLFECGDMNTNNYMQVITAAGDGCKAALDCIKFLQSLEDKK